jgi:hypothetical protein
MKEEINYDRRNFLGSAVMAFAAANIGFTNSASAQSEKINPAGAMMIRIEYGIQFNKTDRRRCFECRIRRSWVP